MLVFGYAPSPKNEAFFGDPWACVGLAALFWSSLAPCLSAMVARSGRKKLRRLLAKFPTFEFTWVFSGKRIKFFAHDRFSNY
jgi:hypothetical protein